jgi:hypothetical protein
MKRRYTRHSLNRLSRRSRILMHWILLHDRSMFGMHVASIATRLLLSWLWFDWSFYWAIGTGLQNLGAIRRKRQENQRAAVRTDRELMRILEHFRKTAPITLR